jgi:hypothetical protein
MEFIIRNHLNVFVLKSKIPFQIQNGAGNKKEFTIKYLDKKYIFERLHNDEEKLILYSYEGDNNCVVLTISKEKKAIVITSIGRFDKCVKGGLNVGSHLLRITLKMVEKYKDYFNINKIVLSDNSIWKCKTGEELDMDKMMILLTGHTWYGNCCQNNNCPRHKNSKNLCAYGKYGFRPIHSDSYELNQTLNKIYDKNIKIMNSVKVKNVPIFKYLEMINEKYPEEFSKEYLNIADTKEIRDTLLKDFLSKFFDKISFDDTCRYFKLFYEELFEELELQVPAKMYGKFL